MSCIHIRNMYVKCIQICIICPQKGDTPLIRAHIRGPRVSVFEGFPSIHNWISYSVWIATACETWHLLQPAGSTPTVTVPPVTEICAPIGQCSTDEFKWFCQCPHILSNSVGIGVKSELRSQLQGEWPNNFHGEWCNALQLTGKIAWRISSYLFHTIYIEAVMIITMKRKV